MTDDYDWRADAYGSWQLAIAELRQRGLREGKYTPKDEAERQYLEQFQFGMQR